MRVINNERVYFVKWKYESPTLLRLLQERGIDPMTALQAKKDGGAPAVLLMLNTSKPEGLEEVKALPISTVTHCIITNEDKEELFRATVRKFPADPYNKDKARKYSLGKLLTKAFPGESNKSVRKNFWGVYLNRHNEVPNYKTQWMSKEMEEEAKIVH